MDKQVAASDATATAYFCGVKTNDKAIGLDSRVRYNNCSSSKGAAVDSFLVLAHRAGNYRG